MAKRTENAQPVPTPGQFAYAGLERTIHEKARLGILTSLMAQPQGVSFNDLKLLCDLTDGNLNRHLEVLVGEGLVQVDKLDQARGRPQSICVITRQGRQRFLAYLQELNRVLHDAAQAADEAPAATRRLNWST
ncbi:MAG: transcriptional regulator [Pirellulales bacterium]